jgi:CRISPR-associated protein Cmr6
MTEECRKAIRVWWENEGRRGTGANAALLMDRFLQIPVNDKEKETAKETEKDHPTSRRELFLEMQRSLKNSAEIYESAFVRHKNSIQKPMEGGKFETSDCRLVIGLGGENVLETGITLNRTYGMPIIPGTALKGLASHYCDRIWSTKDPGFKRDGLHHKTIFGSTAETDEKDSGHIIFHDAWITPKSLAGSLQLDVMTPHHSKYYSDKKGETAPTDFDDPIPITFLSIVGTFYVVVSCDVDGEMDQSKGKTEGQKWAGLTFNLLTEALRDWGIGGKTNAGYGRLVLANSDSVSEQSSAKTADSKIPPSGPDVQKLEKQHPPAEKKPKYKKGNTVDVIKVPDPNEKRGEAYFMADDGIGGRVVLGILPSIQIGEKARLEINGVMEKEGSYNFAAVGAKREPARQTRGKRGRR